MVRVFIRKLKTFIKIINDDNLTRGMKKFINSNKNYWVNKRENKNKRYCLVDGFHTTPSYLLQSGRIAKAIEEEIGLKPIVILNNIFCKFNNYYHLYSSFNINEFILFKRYLFFPHFFLKAYFLTLMLYMSKMTKNMNSFIEYKYKDIRLGDLIYDSIIRKHDGVYNLEVLRLTYFSYVKEAFFRIIIYEYLLDKYPVKSVVIADVVYLSGILPRIAYKRNIKVVISIRSKVNFYENEKSRYHIRKETIKKFCNKPDLIKKANVYLNKRFKGEVNNYDAVNAYKNKKLYNKVELAKILKMDIQNPCVFIMSHAFSDAPHISGLFIYRDYYQWFIETLNIIRDVKNVNWIIKPHPSSKMFNEVGVVEKIIKNYYSDNKNIFLCPSDLNTNSIKDISRAIVTVQGTVTMEYACLGIPTIICANAHYHGYGFTNKAESINEYKLLLQNIIDIKPLNKKQIEMAKIYYYWHACYSDIPDTIMASEIILPGDDFISKREKIFNEMSVNLKNNDPKDNFYDSVRKFIKTEAIF